MDTNSSKELLTFVNSDGQPVVWKKLSARIPEFLEKYPLGTYSLTTDVTDVLALQPGLKELYLKCIDMKVAPETMGLPPIAGFLGVIVSRTLMEGDRVVAKASAQSSLVEYKDYERVETAALQRLLSLLGFPGAVDDGSFDDDEGRDLVAQGLTVYEEHEPTMVVAAQPVVETTVEQQGASVAELGNAVIETELERGTEILPDSEEETGEVPDIATLRMIRHQVSLEGEDPNELIPDFVTMKQALDWLDKFKNEHSDQTSAA